VWAGAGALPGHDGWLRLVPAEAAPLLLPAPDEALALTPVHDAVLEALTDGAALFFRGLSDRVGSTDDAALIEVVWDLVWAGHLTNDTLTPLRARTASTARGSRPPAARTARPGRYSRPRYGRPAMPTRTGPPTAAGRWWRLPERETDATRRSHALTEALLDRHGILTRGAVGAEDVPGGFSGVYPVLRAFEDAGRSRRGYYVETLGAAQFAVPGAVDRMRALAAADERRAEEPMWTAPGPQLGPPARPDDTLTAVVLAATDPANPFGAALAWPDRPPEQGGHRPGRKAGAVVVVVDGNLVLYVEKGGRSLLSWTEQATVVQPAADALAVAVREGALGRLAVERADGEHVLASDLGHALETAGFRPTPRGLRLRA